MRNKKSMMNPNKKKTNLSLSGFLLLAGMVSLFVSLGTAVIMLQTGIEIPLSIPYSFINLSYILFFIGLLLKFYPLIKNWHSNFKCLYTPKFDDHLFNSGIFKKESEDTIIIPLVGDDPKKDASKFFIYAPYDFSDQLLKAKDHINAFLAKERCTYRIIDCYLDDDRVVYICQRKINLDRIDHT